MKIVSGCGVTANIPVLGTGDSGFESRHPDIKKQTSQEVIFYCRGEFQPNGWNVRDSKGFSLFALQIEKHQRQ